ncbi:PASTA domain-containing protein [Actinomadura napierensis]|uniref:PASTA domain-containing protein n=1 Tax=Actinomadura napierensis TaxID=267854 RepID=A0ABP5LDZ8_9ACTN
MPRIILTTVVVAATVALTACEPATSTAAPAKTVTVAPTPSDTVTPASKATPTPVKTRTEPTRIRVPNVVGHNHQKAQNEMQAHGLYMLAEKDATGQGRMLLWDRNWVVVRQTPHAGTLVKSTATITLYSKKIGE